MKKGMMVFCVLIVIGAVGAVAMSKKYVSGTWRYKMTVVVETPEGIKTGSAVREVHAQRQPSILSSSGVTTKRTIRGEAVVVDLGQRGVLFAILGTNGSYEIVYEAFAIAGVTPEEVILHYDSLYKQIGDKKAVLKRSMRDYPQLVTFTDIDDPKTVRGVHRKKLDEVFGEGVKLKEIYIQMTDEPVTWGIKERLKWLSKIKGGYLDGQFTGGGPELSNILHGGNFKRGEK